MKLLLVDDHALFRDGLAMLLSLEWPQWQWEAVGTLAEAKRALADTDEGPGLVLLDLDLPDSRGLDSLNQVRALAPGLRVVVVSGDERPDTVMAAIEAGAAGYIGKSADASRMVAAVHTVLDGGVHLPPQVLDAVPASPPAREGDGVGGLTPRQLDVLARVLQGQPNKQVARDLGMSLSTVKTHLSEIYRRLDVSSRTQAVVAAARLGLRF